MTMNIWHDIDPKRISPDDFIAVIAFIGGPNNLDMVRRRKHGYLEALRENRITTSQYILSKEE